MKISDKILAISAMTFAMANIAHAHPGHDGHDLTWDFHALLGPPVPLILGAIIASAIIFRVADRQK